MEPQEKFLTTGQLMNFLEISRSTIFRLRRRGLPSVRIGTSVRRFPVEGVLKWLKQNYGDTPSD